MVQIPTKAEVCFEIPAPPVLLVKSAIMRTMALYTVGGKMRRQRRRLDSGILPTYAKAEKNELANTSHHDCLSETALLLNLKR